MRVLALTAHPDDLEFGAGGYVARLREQKHDVHVLVFSSCDISDEARGGASELGMTIDIRGWPKRKLNEWRQNILDAAIETYNSFKPDVVLTHSSHDCHQDHQVVYQEAIRACRNTSVLGFCFPWNAVHAQAANAVAVLDHRHIEKKIAALGHYKSQAHRHYSDRSMVESMARVAGAVVGKPYGEIFEVIRWVL